MPKNLKSKIILLLFLVDLVWWLALYLTHTKYQSSDYWYQIMLAVIPLSGGLFGLLNAKKWGWLKSSVGKGIFFLSLGLITWGIGQIYWSYATIAQIEEVPYPSLADVGYILSWPLWAYGMINLSRATGARFALRNIKGKAALFIVPFILIAFSYYFLITVARGGSIDFHNNFAKVFFDLAYPIGDVVILTISTLIFGLSFKYLGGRYRGAIMLILAGFVLNYFTDFTFSYTTTADTYYNGHFVDMMFPTVMTLLSVGVSLLDPALGQKKAEKEASTSATRG